MPSFYRLIEHIWRSTCCYFPSRPPVHKRENPGLDSRPRAGWKGSLREFACHTGLLVSSHGGPSGQQSWSILWIPQGTQTGQKEHRGSVHSWHSSQSHPVTLPCNKKACLHIHTSPSQCIIPGNEAAALETIRLLTGSTHNYRIFADNIRFWHLSAAWIWATSLEFQHYAHAVQNPFK